MYKQNTIRKAWIGVVTRYIFNKYIKNNMHPDGWVSQFKEPNYIRYLPNHDELFDSKTFYIYGGSPDFHIRPKSLASSNY